MKRKLLTCNVILYGVLLGISLLYVGYEYGVSTQYPYPKGPEWLLLPAAYLVFLVIGIRLLHQNVCCTEKTCCATGIATLLYACLFWGSRLLFYYAGRMTMSDCLDIYIYPAVLFLLSIVIAVCYFICARKPKNAE